MTQYLVLSATRLPYSSTKVDEEMNRLEGIYHLKIGTDSGLVKSIDFQRTNHSHIRDWNIIKAYNTGDTGIGAIKEPYNATVKLFGAGFFRPGMYVYLNPALMGFGDPTTRLSLARSVGLGGFYLINKVTTNIESGRIETTLDCVFEYYGNLAGQLASAETQSQHVPDPSGNGANAGEDDISSAGSSDDDGISDAATAGSTAAAEGGSGGAGGGGAPSNVPDPPSDTSSGTSEDEQLDQAIASIGSAPLGEDHQLARRGTGGGATTSPSLLPGQEVATRPAATGTGIVRRGTESGPPAELPPGSLSTGPVAPTPVVPPVVVPVVSTSTRNLTKREAYELEGRNCWGGYGAIPDADCPDWWNEK
jgi:hypothetical protein